MTSFQDKEIADGWDDVLGKDKYRLKLAEIADNYPDQRSLFVDYNDLDAYSTDLAMFILENPDRCLGIGRKEVQAAMPPSWDPQNKLNLRIQGLPRDAKVDIRRLRAKHLGKLVAVEGLVRKVTTVKPRMIRAKFKCARCGQEIWIDQHGMILEEPVACTNPDGNCNKQANRFLLDEVASQYIDTQKVEIQESPEGLRGGAQPERLSAYIEDDIAGIVTAGNRITLNGIIRSLEKPDRDKSTVFEVYIDVLSIEFEQHEYDEIQITEEDEQAILAMSRDPNLFSNIVNSISPTIYGMKEVKSAIALQLFGGCHKVMDDGTVIRGDMHFLLVGDPGVAKSQILRYMSMLAPRGIYASGKSASAAGLTAAAVKDDFGDGRWTLEAGALVLADKGLACIDELDKMTPQDRSSLHEAMESQKISVAKAGITATLQCRCSMLAAANPKMGRFEEGNIAKQIDLPPALMSRFDLIFPLTDKPERTVDQRITNHILNVHRRGEAQQLSEDVKIPGVDVKEIRESTSNIKPFYDPEMLRKYVAYSKRIVPVMTDEATKMIADAYLNIRGSSTDGSVPITARQLEAFVRLAEASARSRLSHTVDKEDAKIAVDLVQYYLQKIAGTSNGGLDIDMVSTSFSHKDRSDVGTITDLVTLAGSEGIAEADIVTEAGKQGIGKEDVERILQQLKNNGTLYCPTDKVYKVVG
ncbi:MAG: minichromosome maintenance protein MCM [Methanomethylophilus sp.]